MHVALARNRERRNEYKHGPVDRVCASVYSTGEIDVMCLTGGMLRARDGCSTNMST